MIRCRICRWNWYITGWITKKDWQLISANIYVVWWLLLNRSAAIIVAGKCRSFMKIRSTGKWIHCMVGVRRIRKRTVQTITFIRMDWKFIQLSTHTCSAMPRKQWKNMLGSTCNLCFSKRRKDAKRHHTVISWLKRKLTASWTGLWNRLPVIKRWRKPEFRKRKSKKHSISRNLCRCSLGMVWKTL